MDQQDDVGTAVTASVTAAVEALATRRDALTDELLRLFAAEITSLQHDDELLGLLAASTEENIVVVLHLLQHGLDVDAVEAPAAAVQYARRLAQRGVPLSALLRSYRLGHARFLEALLEALSSMSGIEPAVTGAAGIRLSRLTTRYIDRVVELVATAYENEREAWLNDRFAVRAARVAALLADEPVDVATTEGQLGYRLTQTHLALHLWLHTPVPRDDALLHVHRLAQAIAAPAAGRALVLPGDEASAVMWMAAPGGDPDLPALERALRASPLPFRLSVGEPGAGIGGFRSSYRQATQAKSVALAAGPSGLQITTYRQVGAVALLCANLVETRAWIADVLGPLAADDPYAARLRETVHALLLAGGSFTAAARVLNVHRNTVQYRVIQAERLRGRSVREDPADLELALRARELLGGGVLPPT